MPPFFHEIRPSPEIARGYVYLLDAVDIYMAKGMPAQAERVRAVLRQMWGKYGQLEATQGAKADEFIRGRIRATAVRPPTSGALERAVQSHTIPSQWNLAGVGIADEAALDAGAVNARGGIYWRTQEYGYTGNVGRRVRGYFMPGVAAPSQAEFRDHPYFEATRSGPRMVIRRPIDAKHFLRDGTVEFIAWRDVERRRISRAAVSSLARI